MSEENFERATATTDSDIVNGRGIGMPASFALACKLIGQNKFNEEFGRWMKTPVSWLIYDLHSLINDESQKRLTIVLAIVAFQAEELNPQNINSDLLNKFLKLKNCGFNSNCLTVTLKELKRTYLEEKNGVFSFQVPVVGRVLSKIMLQKYPELISLCDEKIRKRCVCDSLPTNIFGEYRKSFYIK